MREPIPANIPVITWADQRVITTELLARQYGTAVTNIKSNFNYNKARFVEGKHYFRLSGRDLRDFKKVWVANSDPVTSPHSRELLLWTKRGAARHAKMLETNQAWDVFEALEEAYFELETVKGAVARPSTVHDREPILIDAVLVMVRHRISLPFIYRGLAHFVGTDRLKNMTTEQVSQAHSFAGRLLTGQDTGSDWRQLANNRDRLNVGQLALDLTPASFGVAPEARKRLGRVQ